MHDGSATSLLPTEELLEGPAGEQYELVDGLLTERHMGALSGWVGGQLLTRMNQFCTRKPIGWVFPSDVGYRCFPGRQLVRKPDLSFIRLGRLPNEVIPKGDITLAPDLAVEVVSPNDLYSEVEKKVEEYLQAGVRQIRVIDPDNRKARIHRADGSVSEVRAGGELDGADLLPGFRCPLLDLLPPSETPPAPQAD